MDLHIHTNLSDGVKSPIEILSMAQKEKLEYISITDHDNCFAYEQLENINIKEHFNGKLITGVEIMTCFDGIMIEVLGYGVDYHIINKWTRDYYSKEQIEKRDRDLFEELKRVIKKDSKIKLTDNLKLPDEIPYTGYFKYMIYNDILKHQENEEFLKKNNINTYEQFLRGGLSKKSSPIYFNQEKFIVNLQDVVKLIHNSGGLAFLAHLYKYPIDDCMNFIKKLVDNKIELDGIETSYSSFSSEQQQELEHFTKENKLFKSGGSDYHGKDGRTEKIGYGANGKRIPKEYIEEWYKLIDGGKYATKI